MAQTTSAVRTYPRIRRLLGGALALAAVLSLLVSILAVYQVWSLRGRVARSADSGLTLLSDTLTTSDRALSSADHQLVVAQESLASAERSARNVSGTMSATRDSLRTSAALVGTQLPATIRTTQASIENAQSSARLIDNVLLALASVPFLGIDYRPEVPLSEQLTRMARSLDVLPGLTTDLGRQIDDTATEFDDAQAEMLTLADELKRSQAGFAESRAAIAEFREEVGEARDVVARAREQAPSAINWVALGLTFALAWLVVVQVATLVLGLDWLLTRFPELERL